MIDYIHVLPSNNKVCINGVTNTFSELNECQEAFMQEPSVTGVRLCDNTIIYLNRDSILCIFNFGKGIQIVNKEGFAIGSLTLSRSDVIRVSKALHGE